MRVLVEGRTTPRGVGVQGLGEHASWRRHVPAPPPLLCSSLRSSGWLVHWGEAMANTSTEVLAQDTRVLLEFANSTGSLNFYMVHGGRCERMHVMGAFVGGEGR